MQARLPKENKKVSVQCANGEGHDIVVLKQKLEANKLGNCEKHLKTPSLMKEKISLLVSEKFPLSSCVFSSRFMRARVKHISTLISLSLINILIIIIDKKRQYWILRIKKASSLKKWSERIIQSANYPNILNIVQVSPEKFSKKRILFVKSSSLFFQQLTTCRKRESRKTQSYIFPY